jgi:hypothetical protein
MKAATPLVLCLALSFTVVTLVGCNAAPAPTTTEKKADGKPVKPGKRPANTTDK